MHLNILIDKRKGFPVALESKIEYFKQLLLENKCFDVEYREFENADKILNGSMLRIKVIVEHHWSDRNPKERFELGRDMLKSFFESNGFAFAERGPVLEGSFFKNKKEKLNG